MPHPTPPPTSNYLDSSQRNRLLRSTRKLEALLGTTPYLVEPDISPPSPATRAHRREGRIFGRHSSPSSSPSSSRSSSLVKASQDSDESYIFVDRPSSLEDVLLPRKLKLDPWGAQQEAPLCGKERRSKKKRHAKATNSKSGPRAISVGKGKMNNCANAKTKGLSPSPLPYSLVSSLRSVPMSLADPRPTLQQSHSFLRPNQIPCLSLRVGFPVLHVPSTPTTPITPMPLTPLSPLSPTLFTSNNSEFLSEHDRRKAREQENEREHDQRRKKIAKLTRTLGENVPPELVFHTQEPNTNTDANDFSTGLIRKFSKSLRPFTAADTGFQRTSPSVPGRGDSAGVCPDLIVPCPSSPPSSHLPPAQVHPAKQADTTLTVTIPSRTYHPRPRSLSLDMGSESRKRGRESGSMTRSAGGASEKEVAPTTQVQNPPSFVKLFDPLLEADTNEPLPPSYNRRMNKTHRHAHSSPPTSPGGVYVNISTSFSDSHETPTRTPTPTPPLASKLPSLLNRKRSGSKTQSNHSPAAGMKSGKRSHNGKSKSISIVDEVFGLAIGRSSSRTGTESPHSAPSAGPSSQHPEPPIPRSGTQHPLECGRRREREWSGEWNRGDMGEVVRALRGLKAR